MARIDAFFKLMHEQGASDLHLTASQPPSLRIRGDIERIKYKVLDNDDLRGMLYEITPEEKIKVFEETGDVDFGYEIPGLARYRANFFMQKNGVGAVFREIPTAIMTAEQLGLPPVISKLATLPRGLVLVTGPTGSGKSTTLASIIDVANRNRKDHIITIEDPIEFVHPHKKCTFNQRELGNDFDSFANGLRAALRQAPKVILVGEMRDRETMEIGLSAAETGHLVMSTLHTVDAGQTINRILGFFDQEEQPQIRNRLTDTIRYIISQRLMPKEGGDRVAAFEILANNLRVRDLILNGETEDRTFYDVIEDGSALGMQTFDQHILELYENGLISEETAKTYASRKSSINRGLDKIKAARGEATSGITGLAMKKKDIH